MKDQTKKDTTSLTNTSRRNFLKNVGISLTGLMIVPRYVLGGKGYVAPSDRLNVAGVGVGGRGFDIVKGAYANGLNNIVALCDVDDERAAVAYEAFPNAPRYQDFRKMLEKQKDIDAVMVGTPDHTHAPIALAAMELGKHVYVEKPLTHSIYEARQLTLAAARYPKLATQMGNQGSSMEHIRKITEWIEAGVIGDVRRVHCWTNRPIWPQGVATPTGKFKIPKTLDWNLWLGPAPEREFHPAYLPFKWRGWWDFGTGALGDMGCHIMDSPFKALKLGYPTEVEASVTQVYVGDFVLAQYADSCPPSSKIHLQFPARGEMPPVELIWYDGGILPPIPEELGDHERHLIQNDGGCIFEGERGKILCGIFGRNATLLPTQSMHYFKEPEPTLPRVTSDHQTEWTEACKNGTPTSSSFEYAGPLTETVLMGNLAIRSFDIKNLKDGKKPTDWDPWNFPGRKRLLWDGANMKITNFDEANAFVQRTYRSF